MNCRQPENKSTKEDGKMSKRKLTIEEGRVPAKDARGWQIEGQKRRVIGKEYRRLREEFDVGSFMSQKTNGILPRRECWKTDVEPVKAEMQRLGEEAKQGESRSGKREVYR